MTPAAKLALPWVYTGVIASYGMTATLIPEGAAAKLLGARQSKPAVCAVCWAMAFAPARRPRATRRASSDRRWRPSLQAAAEAMKLMRWARARSTPASVHMDVWANEYDALQVACAILDCPTCVHHHFTYLDARRGTTTSTLCMQRSVCRVKSDQRLALDRWPLHLAGVADTVAHNDFLLRATVDGYEFTVFPGQSGHHQGQRRDESVAKINFAKYIGA
ncbi:MAG: hypothetical protein R2851_00250 [Caldilineaceae bacterium]